MYHGLGLIFEYAIRLSDGKFYTGKAGIEAYGEKNEAFTYTEKGAHAKIERMKHTDDYWANATVERIS